MALQLSSNENQNSENPILTDLILTNNLRSFQNSGVIETGLLDFHRMVVTAMKTSSERLNHIELYVVEKCYIDYFRKRKLLWRITVSIIKCNIWWKWKWLWRVYRHLSINSKSSWPIQIKVCKGQPFAIYE